MDILVLFWKMMKIFLILIWKGESVIKNTNHNINNKEEQQETS